MISFAKLALCLSAVLTLGACTVKTSTSDDLDKLMKDTKKNSDTTTTPAPTAPVVDTKKMTDDLNDTLSAGSQPGRVTLEGALVSRTKPVDQVSVELKGGTGWRGTEKAVDASTLILKNSFNSEGILGRVATVINVGCDITKFPEAKGLTPKEIDIDEDSHIVTANARVVLFCNQSDIDNLTLLVRAQTIVLSNASFSMIGVTGGVKMTAIDLKLVGVNKMSASAPNASVTVVDGPSIGVAAANLIGDGTLAIQSKGASYDPQAK